MKSTIAMHLLHRFTALLLAAVLPCYLAGCGTPFGAAAANFLDSPANQAIVSFAVSEGVQEIANGIGTRVPESIQQPLATASVAALSGMTNDAIYAAAKALRGNQNTPQVAIASTLASSVTSQAQVAPVLAQPIADAVQTIANSGVPSAVANESVATALDMGAAWRAAHPVGAATGKAVVTPTQAHRSTRFSPIVQRDEPWLPVLYSEQGEPIRPVNRGNVIIHLVEQ